MLRRELCAEISFVHHVKSCNISTSYHLSAPQKRPFCQWFLVAELVAFCQPEKLTLAHQDRMQGHITGALSSIEEMAQIVTVPVRHWVAQWRFEKRDVEKQWNTSWLVNFWDYHYAVLCCILYTSYTSHTLYSNVGNSHQYDAPNNAWRECFFCSGLTGIFQTYIPLSVSWRNSGSWRYGSGATERYWKVLKVEVCVCFPLILQMV